MGKSVKRLARHFQPENYGLFLDIDPDALSFTGSVRIVGKKIDRPSERFTFHQKDLKITSATIVRHDKRGETNIDIKRINTHDSYDEVRIHTAEIVYPGNYTVTLEFSGQITRPMSGIYPCFFEHDNTPKKLIATQFESHSAREAFPCIDEPEAKATFDLSLRSPAGQTVISNTPVAAQKTEGKLSVTTFETTPRMSSYLLAFVMGEMGYKEKTTRNGTTVRTYATPDNVAYTEFALDAAVKTLEFYNNYFDIPYPLAKCDFIALPDFAAGAMENWGCITFREQALLVDPKNTSLARTQRVAMVIAHELTHQWFGDLVTMRWWSDIWLNESFASWMAYLALDALFPDWNSWMQFVVDEQLEAYDLDALENTHPIEVSIKHPDEIHTIFDAISYEKGASVLRMLHEYLGADVFRDGLRVYLKAHAYANTETLDLWKALENVSHKPVASFMNQWVKHAGFPIVTATVSDDSLSVRQERFYINPKAQKDTEQVWPIPLRPSEILIGDMLRERSATYKLPTDHHKFVLNTNRSSFIRVVYNASHLEKLSEAVKTGRLSPLDRMGIVSDIFEAAKAAYSDTAIALKLVESYAQEDNPMVWDVIAHNLDTLLTIMDDVKLSQLSRLYVAKLVEIPLGRLGWDEKESDTHFERRLRPIILELAASVELPQVIEEATRRFNAMQKPEDLAPDLRRTVFCAVARNGGDAHIFETLLQWHNETPSSEVRVVIGSALMSSEQPELIDKALNLILSGIVRLQDIRYMVPYGFMNRKAKMRTWQWMVDNWQWLSDNIGSDLSFARMPLFAAAAFSNKQELEVFEEFFNQVTSPILERSIKQGVETINWHMAWKERDFTLIEKYFSALK